MPIFVKIEKTHEREPLPDNFSCEELSNFANYFFRDLLELYDWVEKNQKNGKPFFHFMPRFEYKMGETVELLSMGDVIQGGCPHGIARRYRKRFVVSDDAVHTLWHYEPIYTFSL